MKKYFHSKNSLTIFVAAGASLLMNLTYAACSNHLDKTIQQIMDNDRAKYHIPGMQVTVNCPGEQPSRDFVSGTSLKDGGAAIEPDYFFQVGSETKSFIAIIMLQLEAEGVLSIEDKIAKWLPGVNPQWQNITIKQLLNHTSGIFNYTDVIAEMVHAGTLTDFTKQWTANELVDLIKGKPLYFEPSHGWHYSNTNYVLAGMIIEVATKKSVDEQINTRLINKIGLSNTHYWPRLYTNEILQRMAHGYSERGYLPNEPVDVTYVNNSWANAAGGLISNTHDMTTWIRKVSANELLPIPQMIKLTSLVDESDGQPLSPSVNKIGYGLGVQHDFDTFGEEAWWHTGSTLGYNSIVVWLKKSDICFAVNINHITQERDVLLVAKDLAAYIQQ